MNADELMVLEKRVKQDICRRGPKDFTPVTLQWLPDDSITGGAESEMYDDGLSFIRGMLMVNGVTAGSIRANITDDALPGAINLAARSEAGWQKTGLSDDMLLRFSKTLAKAGVKYLATEAVTIQNSDEYLAKRGFFFVPTRHPPVDVRAEIRGGKSIADIRREFGMTLDDLNSTPERPMVRAIADMSTPKARRALFTALEAARFG